MGIPFTKMHGIGNDYVYVNGYEVSVVNPSELSRRISDRHQGIGSDGLILILPPQQGVRADVQMRMFNADGSESEMCGNGIRCVAKYAHDRGLTKAKPIRVQTGRGVLEIDYTTNADGELDTATVDMGEPILELEMIPVDSSKLLKGKAAHTWILEEMTGMEVTFVSLGNPHAVIYVDDLDIELDRIGPRLETHRAFPQRINLHWVQVHSKLHVTMRTWERGSGMTLACGTGACAVCVAGVLTDRTKRKILANLPGGDLELEWRESDNHVHMTGPAVEVFSGVWNE
jgi:diaminopimelate epimerase